MREISKILIPLLGPLLLLIVSLSDNSVISEEHNQIVGWSNSRSRHRAGPTVAWQCPDQEAKTRSSKSIAYLAYYSPYTGQDLNINQARKGWKETDIDRLVNEWGFDLSKPSIIYTHGYMQTINRQWLKNIRQNYEYMLADSNFNVSSSRPFNLLLFDWSAYGQRAYGTSVSYAPYLGRLLSEFINDHLTKRFGYSADNIHLVGYSLSTHIVGYAGKKLKEAGNQLHQITAIDPTGVCFHHDATFADKYQLRPTDAKLVVARHYDMGSLGSRRPIGGLDVFVNGGSNQTSMSYSSGDLFGSALALVSSLSAASSHMRASQHESEPFSGDCYEMAYACRSYEAFLAGECADCGPNGNKCLHVSTLGNVQLQSDPVAKQYKQGTKMYIITGRSRFCQHNYQVLLKLNKRANKSILQSIESGALSAIIAEGPAAAFMQDNTDQQVVRINPSHRVQSSANQFSQLVQLDSRITKFSDQIKLEQANLGLNEAKNLLNSIESLKINYMSHISSSNRRKASTQYCPKQSVKSGEFVLIKC